MLKCAVNLDLYTVTSPGTRLADNSDVYMSICLFGDVQQTETVPAIFPLTFLESFSFERVFHSAHDLSAVTDILKESPVRIDLVQSSNIFEGVRVLAWYQDTAKNFLYPEPPADVPLHRISDRKILLQCSPFFYGLSPKLEFSTKTKIYNASPDSTHLFSRNMQEETIEFPQRYEDVWSVKPKSARRVSVSRPLQNHRSRAGSRPPFVVRKVEDSLTGRKPTLESGSCCMCRTSEEFFQKHSRSFITGANSLKERQEDYGFWDENSSSVGNRCPVCHLYHKYYGRPYLGHLSEPSQVRQHYYHDPPRNPAGCNQCGRPIYDNFQG